MLIIDVQKFNSIDQALKVYKNKTNKTNLIKQLRERQTYTKPSVSRRKEVLDAIYRENRIKNL